MSFQGALCLALQRNLTFAFLSFDPIQAVDLICQQLQRPLLAGLLLHSSALYMHLCAVAHPPEVFPRVLRLRHASAHRHHWSRLQEGTGTEIRFHFSKE